MYVCVCVYGGGGGICAWMQRVCSDKPEYRLEERVSRSGDFRVGCEVNGAQT